MTNTIIQTDETEIGTKIKWNGILQLFYFTSFFFLFLHSRFCCCGWGECSCCNWYFAWWKRHRDKFNNRHSTTPLAYITNYIRSWAPAYLLRSNVHPAQSNETKSRANRKCWAIAKTLYQFCFSFPSFASKPLSDGEMKSVSAEAQFEKKNAVK